MQAFLKHDNGNKKMKIENDTFLPVFFVQNRCEKNDFNKTIFKLIACIKTTLDKK